MSMKKKKKSVKNFETPKNNKEINVRRFALTYLLVMGGFFFLIGFKPLQEMIDINGIYTNFIIVLTTKILGFFDIPATHHGSIINLPSIALDVRFGCNGLEAVMMYAVAVIIYPSGPRVKAMGIIAGFLIIQTLNLIRISGLAYAGIYHKKLFHIVHIYIAQGLMIAVALGVYLLYLYYAEIQSKKLA